MINAVLIFHQFLTLHFDICQFFFSDIAVLGTPPPPRQCSLLRPHKLCIPQGRALNFLNGNWWGMVKISEGRKGECQFFWCHWKINYVFCNIIDKPLRKWSSFYSSSMKDVFIIITILPLLCAVNSSVYMIITTFTFILLLLTTSEIVFIFLIIIIIIIVIIIIIIMITIISININPPFSLSQLLKWWLSLQLLSSQDLNQLSQLRRDVNDQ